MDQKIVEKLKTDNVLADILNSIKPPNIDSTGNIFHDLMSCLIEQQIHYRSTKKTFKKLLAKADIQVLTLENFSKIEPHLSVMKLFARKFETIAGVLHFFESETIDWKSLSNDEIKKIFKDIKGVGAWTVDMILLYTLQRPNIFPIDDYHLKELTYSLYPMEKKGSKKEMRAIAEQWSPYESYAVLSLFEWKKVMQKKV